MSIDCEISLGGDGEPISGFKAFMTTDDTETTCVECRRKIPAGQERERATGELNDEAFEVDTCLDCHHIAKGLQTEGRDYGSLWAQLEEHGGEDENGAFEQFTTGCLDKVETASAKQYLVERFKKWKGLSAEGSATK